MGRIKQQTSYPLRIPEELKAWLKARADTNFRSVNAEIIALLLEVRQREEESREKSISEREGPAQQ